jgi:hypothetical protein
VRVRTLRWYSGSALAGMLAREEDIGNIGWRIARELVGE